MGQGIVKALSLVGDVKDGCGKGWGVVAGVLRNEIQCDWQGEGVVQNVGNTAF